MTDTQREILSSLLSTGWTTSHPVSKRVHAACMQLADMGLIYNTGRIAGGVEGSIVWGLHMTRMAIQQADKNRTAKEAEQQAAVEAWKQL